MGSFFQRVVIPVLIFTIATPISMGGREDDPDIDDTQIGRYLRAFCSDTRISKQCWKIIKPEINRFTNTDIRNIAGIVIDVTMEKTVDVVGEFSQLWLDSSDDALKKKYRSCAESYVSANHNLDAVRSGLYNPDVLQEISGWVDNVEGGMKSCKREFGGKSFDPAHVRNRNKEYRNYVEIVRTATNKILSNRDRKG
ncbi:hypothetical protein ACS0TY_018881 [Phlomoides rotata]